MKHLQGPLDRAVADLLGSIVPRSDLEQALQRVAELERELAQARQRPSSSSSAEGSDAR